MGLYLMFIIDLLMFIFDLLMFIIDLIIHRHRQYVVTLVAIIGFVENVGTQMSMQDMASVLNMIVWKNMEEAGMPDFVLGSIVPLRVTS